MLNTIIVALVATAISGAFAHPSGLSRMRLFLASVQRKRFLFSAVPSWLFSLLVHLTLILILAAITLDPVAKVISILQAGAAAEQRTAITVRFIVALLERFTFGCTGGRSSR